MAAIFRTRLQPNHSFIACPAARPFDNVAQVRVTKGVPGADACGLRGIREDRQVPRGRRGCQRCHCNDRDPEDDPLTLSLITPPTHGSAAVAADGQVQAVGGVVTDYDYAAIVAAFADEDAAYSAYEALQDAEATGGLGIEGVLVIKTDEEAKVKIQKMTDHSTKTGAKWGAVGGVVLGIIFPPTILASAVGFGVLGGLLGKVRNVAHKSMVSDALAGTVGPNESGIVALVKAGDLEAAKAAMPTATKVRTAGVDQATAQQVVEAAKQAG